MSRQEKNFESPEEELEPVSVSFKIPSLLKGCVTICSIAIIGACTFLFIEYIHDPDTYAKPSDLGLSSIFLFSISALFLVWIPWQSLGMRITKIGGIEFKEIVEEQATEHAEEISYLQSRVEMLEGKVRQIVGITEMVETFEEPHLRKILLDFLTKYKDWAFSPARIRIWGAQQQGFSSLANYEHPFLRSTLQKMVSEGLLETRISKKGNTLYRIAQS
jgi:hypothetical protein